MSALSPLGASSANGSGNSAAAPSTNAGTSQTSNGGSSLASNTSAPTAAAYNAQGNAISPPLSPDPTTWTQAQIQAFSATDIGSLTTQQLQSLSRTQVGWFTTSQIPNLSAAQINALYSGQSNLTLAQTATLTYNQIAGLSGATIAQFSVSQLNQLQNYSYTLAYSLQQGSSPESAGGTASYIQLNYAVTYFADTTGNTGVGTFSGYRGDAAQLSSQLAIQLQYGGSGINAYSASGGTADFTVVTDGHFASQHLYIYRGDNGAQSGYAAYGDTLANAKQAFLDAFGYSSQDVAALSASDISKLSATQIVKFSNAEITSLSASQVSGLNYNASGLSASQVGAISSSTIASLSTDAISQLSGPSWNATSGFTAAQIANFSNQQVASIRSIQQLSTEAFSAFSASQLSALTPQQHALLSAAQLQLLAQAAVAPPAPVAPSPTAQPSATTTPPASPPASATTPNATAPTVPSAQVIAVVTTTPTPTPAPVNAPVSAGTTLSSTPANTLNSTTPTPSSLAPTSSQQSSAGAQATVGPVQSLGGTAAEVEVLPGIYAYTANDSGATGIGAYGPDLATAESLAAAANPNAYAAASGSERYFQAGQLYLYTGDAAGTTGYAAYGPTEAAAKQAFIAAFGAPPSSTFSGPLAALSPADLASITPAELATLSPTQFSGLTPAQLGSFSVDQLNALSSQQLTAVNSSILQSQGAVQGIGNNAAEIVYAPNLVAYTTQTAGVTGIGAYGPDLATAESYANANIAYAAPNGSAEFFIASDASSPTGLIYAYTGDGAGGVGNAAWGLTLAAAKQAFINAYGLGPSNASSQAQSDAVDQRSVAAGFSKLSPLPPLTPPAGKPPAITDWNTVVSDVITEAWNQGVRDNAQFAYLLATADIETGHESPGEGNYEQKTVSQENSDYNGTNGNIPGTNDGSVFAGRGVAQLTGRELYQNFGNLLGLDLIDHPDWAADPLIGARILVSGSLGGLFRQNGRGIQYYEKNGVIDFSSARDISNPGADSAERAKFNGFAQQYLSDLNAGVYKNVFAPLVENQNLNNKVAGTQTSPPAPSDPTGYGPPSSGTGDPQDQGSPTSGGPGNSGSPDNTGSPTPPSTSGSGGSDSSAGANSTSSGPNAGGATSSAGGASSGNVAGGSNSSESGAGAAGSGPDPGGAGGSGGTSTSPASTPYIGGTSNNKENSNPEALPNPDGSIPPLKPNTNPSGDSSGASGSGSSSGSGDGASSGAGSPDESGVGDTLKL